MCTREERTNARVPAAAGGGPHWQHQAELFVLLDVSSAAGPESTGHAARPLGAVLRVDQLVVCGHANVDGGALAFSCM